MSKARSLRFWIAAAGVLVLACFVCLPGLAEQPFYTKGEPREAVVVWEMANGGGWVLPLRNGTEIPSKPPFFHWLGLLSSNALGEVSELSVRLPSALLSIAAVFLVFLFGAHVGRIRSGWLAATALLLCFEWARAARIARVDMTVTFFLSGALLLFAVMQRSGCSPHRLVLFYACVAAATLGKGPVGIALPAAVIATYALVAPISGEIAPSLRGHVAARLANLRAIAIALSPLRGLLAVLAIVGAWYAAASALGGTEFLVKHVLKENVLRVLNPDVLDTGHRHGPFYLFPQFLLGALPWSLLAPGVAWFAWRSRPLDSTLRYLVVWFVVVIVFFSIPASKRSVYILPAYPAGALLLGLVLGPGPEGAGPRRLVGWGISLAAAAVGAVGLASLVVASGLPIESWLAPLLRPKDLQGTTAALEALRAVRWQTILAGLAITAGAWAAGREARGAHWLRANLALSACLALGIQLVALRVDRALAESRSLRPFIAQVRTIVGDEPLTFYRAFDYGAVFYAGRHIGTWHGDLGDPTAEPPRHLLLWADEAARQAAHLRILLESTGTGPKGRTAMVLAEPRSRATEPAS